MSWREGKTYNIASTLFEGVRPLKFFGDLHLVWLESVVHMFYNDEQTMLTDNRSYQQGDLIGLRDEDIISSAEGRGRSGGFPY
jgi:hypothetical protein